MSILHQQLISALREAGDEGLDESEIMALGGMWWRTRLKEIRRWRLAVIGEENGRFYLVSGSGVESDRGEAESGRAEIPTVALNTEPLSLFPSTVSHYTMDEAA